MQTLSGLQNKCKQTARTQELIINTLKRQNDLINFFNKISFNSTQEAMKSFDNDLRKPVLECLGII